uniref:Uncharacterized protein n=1 Tax=Oryza glumipatula TaxID=40148 RepID=A0A0D9ZW72_9ORYZ
MDSDEKEKKRENKETITKKMEIKRIKQTRENIPGTKFAEPVQVGCMDKKGLKNETQKDKDINKQGKIQAQIQVLKEIAGLKPDGECSQKKFFQKQVDTEITNFKQHTGTGKLESEEGGINAGETMRRKFQKTGLEEIKRDIQISGYIIEKENFNRKKYDLQSKLAKLTTEIDKKNIQSGQNARGGTETPNATSYGAQILYNQYSLLNEDGRLMEAGKMSYTNLMQQIIQSPRVTMQTNEEGIEAYTNLLQTPVAFDVNGTTMAMQSNEHPNEEDIQQNSRNENVQGLLRSKGSLEQERNREKIKLENRQAKERGQLVKTMKEKQLRRGQEDEAKMNR